MSKHNLRVLFVDDEPDMVFIFNKGLTRHGFEVDAFTDPLRALSSYKPDYYDVIILDVRMPAMSGFELAQAILQQDPQAKIYFLSANELYKDEAAKLFPTLKREDFLTKPMSIVAMTEHIKAKA